MLGHESGGGDGRGGDQKKKKMIFSLFRFFLFSFLSFSFFVHFFTFIHVAERGGVQIAHRQVFFGRLSRGGKGESGARRGGERKKRRRRGRHTQRRSFLGVEGKPPFPFFCAPQTLCRRFFNDSLPRSCFGDVVRLLCAAVRGEPCPGERERKQKRERFSSFVVAFSSSNATSRQSKRVAVSLFFASRVPEQDVII